MQTPIDYVKALPGLYKRRDRLQHELAHSRDDTKAKELRRSLKLTEEQIRSYKAACQTDMFDVLDAAKRA